MTDNAPAPSPLDTLARLIDLYDGCARAGILSDLGRADRANLEALRAVWAALPDPHDIEATYRNYPDRLKQRPGVEGPGCAERVLSLAHVLDDLRLRTGGPDPRPEAFGPNSTPNP